jgi:glycosyltransferase involved in cell wall biosynthesis
MPSSSSRPLVTIAVPVRNGARHLLDAFDSALAQEYHRCAIFLSMRSAKYLFIDFAFTFMDLV